MTSLELLNSEDPADKDGAYRGQSREPQIPNPASLCHFTMILVSFSEYGSWFGIFFFSFWIGLGQRSIRPKISKARRGPENILA
jgi:hypothetical protein